jgi:hypothetical protein
VKLLLCARLSVRRLHLWRVVAVLDTSVYASKIFIPLLLLLLLLLLSCCSPSGGRGDARPVHSTPQNPFQDVMAQRELWGQGGTTLGMVEIGVPKGQPTATLHGGGVGGQHGQAKTVPEAGLDFCAFELQSSRERESDQPSRGRTAGAAKKACEGALAPICPGAVKWPEGFRVAVHGAVCGGGRSEVCGDAVGGAGVGQAQPAVAMGEGDTLIHLLLLLYYYIIIILLCIYRPNGCPC